MKGHMTERFPAPPEQLTVVSTQEILEEQDMDRLADLRRHLFQVAQANLEVVNEITKVLKAEGVEKGARLRKITGPAAIDVEARND